MSWNQPIGCLDLNKNRVLDDEVCAIRTRKGDIPVQQAKGNLLVECESRGVQLVRETALVDAFEKPWANVTVDAYRAADN